MDRPNPNASSVARANCTVAVGSTFLQAPMAVHQTFPGRVVVTPLGTSTTPSFIKKILLKAVSKGSKKEPKMFMLRNMNLSQISTSLDLMFLIKAQLKEDMIKDNFDVGYLQNTTVIILRSKYDLSELWDNVRRGQNITLWCDGMKLPKVTTGNRKRSSLDSLDSDDEESEVRAKNKKKTKHEEKEEKVEKIISDLKEKHTDSSYTPMQYRIWAEMMAGGVHSSCDEHHQCFNVQEE